MDLLFILFMLYYFILLYLSYFSVTFVLCLILFGCLNGVKDCYDRKMVRPRRQANEPEDELPRGDGNYAMARALNRMTEFLQQNFRPPQGDLNRAVQVGCTYERFLAHRTPAFTGEEDPLRARRWIEDLERTF